MRSTGTSYLGASIHLNPSNTPNGDLRNIGFIRYISGALTVGDLSKAITFGYRPRSARIFTTNSTQYAAKMLYNAVITRDPVTLEFRKKLYRLALPSPDDAFKSFARSCPITNGGNKDLTVFEAIEGTN